MITTPNALHDIIEERGRQIAAEGWTREHDDEHINGEMARAAAAYAYAGSLTTTMLRGRLTDTSTYGSTVRSIIEGIWPWGMKWWKPKNPRYDLVRAGALIVAEIERIDRANSPKDMIRVEPNIGGDISAAVPRK